MPLGGSQTPNILKIEGELRNSRHLGRLLFLGCVFDYVWWCEVRCKSCSAPSVHNAFHRDPVASYRIRVEVMALCVLQSVALDESFAELLHRVFELGHVLLGILRYGIRQRGTP